MDLKLSGKKALITGGSKGIGLAIKKALEKEGVKVTSLSRSEGWLLDAYHPQYKGLEAIFPYLKKYDILINNFGGGGTWTEPEKIMYKNYGITQRLTNEWLKTKRRSGRVITISSIYGKEKGYNPYFDAAKAAQIAFMRCLAGTWSGITFNTICPGHIDVGKPFPDNPKVTGKPEDVANIVTFLCSDLAKHINGAIITVDGGESRS